MTERHPSKREVKEDVLTAASDAWWWSMSDEGRAEILNTDYCPDCGLGRVYGQCDACDRCEDDWEDWR